MAKIKVELTNETTVSVEKAPIQQHLAMILDRLGETRELTVELKITSKAAIRQLNREFLQKDYPTDVLSFPAPDEVGESGENLLGSIAICQEIAQQQATEAGISLTSEVKMLSGHSLLHLLGYHHR